MKPKPVDDSAALRRAAERHLKKRPSAKPLDNEADLRRIQHELEVHQIELEMQNEELRAARAAIEAELERYSDHFDFAPVGYFNLNAKGIIQLVNLMGAKLVGVERGRMKGRRFSLLVAEPDRLMFTDFLAQVFNLKTRQTCELTLVPEGGPVLFVRLEAALSPDGTECRTAILDITGLKRAEEAQRHGSERLSGIVNSAMDAIISIDARQHILLFNAAAEHMFGYRASDVIGKTLEILLPSRVHAAHTRHVATFAGSGTTTRKMNELGALSGLRANGEEFPIEASISQVNIVGEVLCTVILRDITERKRAERNLRRSEEQMRALAARLQFIREEERMQIAREIHDVLAQELTLLKFDIVWVNRRLAIAVDESTRASLVEKLDGLSMRTNSVIETVQKIATDLRPVVLDRLGLFAAVEWQVVDFEKRTGIVCHAAVPTSSVPIGRDQATAVFRILQESLTNVLRHAQATRMDVELVVQDDQLTLTVRDNGCGISTEKLADLNSIGLAGMRERALVFNGHIDIEGSAGAGTVVTVRMQLFGPAENSAS